MRAEFWKLDGEWRHSNPLYGSGIYLIWTINTGIENNFSFTFHSIKFKFINKIYEPSRMIKLYEAQPIDHEEHKLNIQAWMQKWLHRSTASSAK